MALTFIIAAAAMAHIPAAVAQSEQPSSVDVAYEELAAGQTDAAIAKMEQSRDVSNDDPARLINLGTAYARMGRTDDAREMYRAALLNDDKVDLELADGSWVDSHTAARLALASLENRSNLAMR